MKFIVNCKPLATALDIGVINSNVSLFHKKSTVIQLTADDSTLKLNIESEAIKSEITIKGKGEGEPAKIFVGSLLMKQLVSTLQSSVVELEFTEGGLIIHSGTSKFTLPKMVDDDDIEFSRPESPESGLEETEIDKTVWKYVQDNQMFAISMSFIHPVYTYVWASSDGHVLVGDFDNSLFTYSKNTLLPETCLLSDTIINLVDSLPEGAKIGKADKDYLIYFQNDSLNYVSQFSPKYEGDESIGEYNADIFLDKMAHPDNYVQVQTGMLKQFLNQADILSSSTDDTLNLSISDGVMKVFGDNIDCTVPVNSESVEDFDLDFKVDSIRKVIVNYDADNLNLSPVFDDESMDPAGILVWDDKLTTIVAGVDEV